MNKLILILTLLSFVILSPVLAFAETETTPTPTLTQTQQARQNARLQPRQTRFQRFYAATLSNLEKRFTNINSTRSKIQTRINTAKSKGIDTATAQAKLDLFNPSQYQTDLTALKTRYEELLKDTSLNWNSELEKAAQVVRKDLNTLSTILSNAARALARSRLVKR